MRILNLTQHPASPDQQQAGVFEPSDKPAVQSLLTFTTPPSRHEIRRRASELASIAIAEGARFAMIGGAGYLMGPLEAALSARGIHPLHSFTRRETITEDTPQGARKVSIFRHVGWVGWAGENGPS